MPTSPPANPPGEGTGNRDRNAGAGKNPRGTGDDADSYPGAQGCACEVSQRGSSGSGLAGGLALLLGLALLRGRRRR